MFSFFKKKSVANETPSELNKNPDLIAAPAYSAKEINQNGIQKQPENAPKPDRAGWMSRLKAGLRKTGGSIASVFTGTRIDEALYEELEAALLMSDAGLPATEQLLTELKNRVKNSKATEPAAVRALLVDVLTDMLAPLERSLVLQENKPTVMMIAGVNGAGKTTSIGKLTWHLSAQGASVLLAAADTFRAAAREQLAVWAERNQGNQSDKNLGKVEIIAQESADPASVAFDSVKAGIARGTDVVMVDTAGRLPTQTHLMEELAKIKRVIMKAKDGAQDKILNAAPHEILLVIDGNTGQNALMQAKAFDQSLGLTGLIVTKLDGTAKGGVLAAIAQWAAQRQKDQAQLKPIAVYFIGVGEQLEDLERFDAREFAQALLE